MIRVFSISLGCPKNRVDTERALGNIGPVTLVSHPEMAHCIFINTCGFIAPAVQESVRTILETSEEISSLAPGKRPLVVVAGCLVGRYGIATLAPDLPEVDLLLDNKTCGSWGHQILQALRAAGKFPIKNKRPFPHARRKGARAAPLASGEENTNGILLPEDTSPVIRPLDSAPLSPAHAVSPSGRSALLLQASPQLQADIPLPLDNTALRLLSTGPSYAWLKISDGCTHRCSFCTIPSIRGGLRSTPAAQLKEEARMLVEQGVKELILVAQDTTSWGRDLGEKHGLRKLLEELLPLEGLARLRLMYLYPAGLTLDLLHFLRDVGPVLVPYFDVPMQHAAPDVLSRMGRPFAHNPRAVIERIRSVFPQSAVRTSLIVGFPGETEQDFELLRQFVEETRFLHLGVFAYQAEEGTPAASMPNQIPEREISWRRDVLMDLQGEISEELLGSYVGSKMDVLVDAVHPEWPGLHTGRVWFQAPESDGITYISGPNVKPGAMVSADITEATVYDLVALA